MIDPDAKLLRRYVIERSAGRVPCPEYMRFIEIETIDGPPNGAWQRCSETEARAAPRWRRLRIPGRPWCPVLGPRVGIARDVQLQAHFATVPDGDWYRMEQRARHHPERCLAEWRAAGRRLIDAADAATAGRRAPGRLRGWPGRRGGGLRSLLLPD